MKFKNIRPEKTQRESDLKVSSLPTPIGLRNLKLFFLGGGLLLIAFFVFDLSQTFPIRHFTVPPPPQIPIENPPPAKTLSWAYDKKARPLANNWQSNASVVAFSGEGIGKEGEPETQTAKPSGWSFLFYAPNSPTLFKVSVDAKGETIGAPVERSGGEGNATVLFGRWKFIADSNKLVKDCLRFNTEETITVPALSLVSKISPDGERLYYECRNSGQSEGPAVKLSLWPDHELMSRK